MTEEVLSTGVAYYEGYSGGGGVGVEHEGGYIGLWESVQEGCQ